MAESQEQGTGKHAHKSAAEPFEHHEAPTQKGQHEQGHDSKSHSTQHGSSTSEHSGKNQASASESDDLKSREYTGPDGEVHHHTKAYQESHKK
jgi:hypothetical protein